MYVSTWGKRQPGLVTQILIKYKLLHYQNILHHWFSSDIYYPIVPLFPYCIYVIRLHIRQIMGIFIRSHGNKIAIWPENWWINIRISFGKMKMQICNSCFWLKYFALNKNSSYSCNFIPQAGTIASLYVTRNGRVAELQQKYRTLFWYISDRLE